MRWSCLGGLIAAPKEAPSLRHPPPRGAPAAHPSASRGLLASMWGFVRGRAGRSTSPTPTLREPALPPRQRWHQQPGSPTLLRRAKCLWANISSPMCKS